MEQNDVLMQGYVDLYNPFKINMQNVERKFPGYQWASDDYDVSIKNVHFIHDGEYIELNIQMLDDPGNEIFYPNENDGYGVNCIGLFSINVPRKHLEKFIEKNQYIPGHNDGFEYELYFSDHYNKDNIVTNDCIEIEYPDKLRFTDLKVMV